MARTNIILPAIKCADKQCKAVSPGFKLKKLPVAIAESFNKNDLMKFRNFGKKSLTELEELVNVKGLSFGMDLSKYKLDKD